MTYKARFSNEFLRKEKNLPHEVKKRLIATVKEILVSPYAGIQLHGPLKGLYKRRIGKYRIIYEVSHHQNLVIFHTVDLRKRIYK